MSFISRNHPQQVGLRGALDPVDDRAITPEDFAPLNAEFRFTVDAAASDGNHRLPRYWTKERSGLEADWTGERVWCNPPYSNIMSWVEKAWNERFAEVVVMLLPANRTEQKWWQENIEPRRDRELRLTTRFLRGRMRFLAAGTTAIVPNMRPPFGCVLCIWESPEARRQRELPL